MAFNWIKFPWTNLHDLNLDWIIQTVKTLEDNLTDAIGRFTEIANSLNTERTERIAGDAELQSAANTERTERLAGDAALQTEIENGVYPTINRNINDVNTSINTERTERIAGDAALQSTIDKVIMPLIAAQGVRDFHVAGDASQDGYITAVTFKDGYPKSDLDNLITKGAKIRLVVDHDAMSDYFTLSYSTENGYCGFSGTLIVTQNNTVAGQAIVYNGTDFTVFGNNAT